MDYANNYEILMISKYKIITELKLKSFDIEHEGKEYENIIIGISDEIKGILNFPFKDLNHNTYQHIKTVIDKIDFLVESVRNINNHPNYSIQTATKMNPKKLNPKFIKFSKDLYFTIVFFAFNGIAEVNFTKQFIIDRIF